MTTTLPSEIASSVAVDGEVPPAEKREDEVYIPSDAERFVDQLAQLADMGFADEEAVLKALVATNGNLNATVEHLLLGMGAGANAQHGLSEELFHEWALENTKSCPACGTRVEKNGGCDTITCRCGTNFCYNCGLESAECRARGCKASAVAVGAPATLGHGLDVRDPGGGAGDEDEVDDGRPHDTGGAAAPAVARPGVVHNVAAPEAPAAEHIEEGGYRE